MEIRQLKALVTVAEVGNITRAAELLHLVQPSVTKQITSLERELGVSLFERTRYGVRLTDAGRLMVDRAEQILHDLSRARAEVSPVGNPMTGIVAVGLLESTADLLVGPLLAAVRKSRPHIEIHLMTGHTRDLRRGLDEGRLDLSVLCDVTDTPSLSVEPLLTEQLWVAAPLSAGLRADVPVSLTEVARHPIVTPQTGHPLRIMVDAAALEGRTVLDIAVQASSMPVLKQLVRDGHGWAILPGAGIGDDVACAAMSAAPLYEPAIERHLVLAISRPRTTSAATEYVARELVRQVRTAVDDGRWPSARPTYPSVADTS